MRIVGLLDHFPRSCFLALNIAAGIFFLFFVLFFSFFFFVPRESWEMRIDLANVESNEGALILSPPDWNRGSAAH